MREGISTRVVFIEHMIFEQRPGGSKGSTMSISHGRALWVDITASANVLRKEYT